MKKTVIFLLIVFVGTPFASAAVLDVVAGYDSADSNFSAYDPSTTYATPQEAWSNAVNGDEIAIHAGVYDKIHYSDSLGNVKYPSPFVMNNACDANGLWGGGATGQLTTMQLPLRRTFGTPLGLKTTTSGSTQPVTAKWSSKVK